MTTMAASVDREAVDNLQADQNGVSYSAMNVSDCNNCGYCYYAEDRIAYCSHRHNSLVAVEEDHGKHFVDEIVVDSILDVGMDLKRSMFVPTNTLFSSFLPGW